MIRLVVVALLVCFPAAGFAQVDFTGEWTLLDARNAQTASGLSPLGDHGSIDHTADALTIVRSGMNPRNIGPRTYALDGSESGHTHLAASGDAVLETTRVHRVSNALLFITTTRMGQSNAWDRMVTFSLNGRQELVVTVLSPNLWPFGTSHTNEFVYRKVH